MQLKQTFILKDKTWYFYEKLANIPHNEIIEFMRKNEIIGKLEASTRDKVDYNIAKQAGKVSYSTELSKRKGYNLLTLYINF